MLQTKARPRNFDPTAWLLAGGFTGNNVSFVGSSQSRQTCGTSNTKCDDGISRQRTIVRPPSPVLDQVAPALQRTGQWSQLLGRNQLDHRFREHRSERLAELVPKVGRKIAPRALSDLVHEHVVAIDLVVEFVLRSELLVVSRELGPVDLGAVEVDALKSAKAVENDSTIACQSGCVFDGCNVGLEIDTVVGAEPIGQFYLKLPAWFTVETPVGPYNPDWAIMFESSSKLYLVRETKGSLNPLDRREDENIKIDCARMHFDAIDVDYDVVTSMDDLADQVG